MRSSYTGLVNDIRAYDGLEVKVGDLLLSFDTRELLAQNSVLEEELKDVRIHESVLTALTRISYDQITATIDGDFEPLLEHENIHASSTYNKWAVAELLGIEDYIKQIMQDREILKRKLLSATIRYKKAEAIAALIKKGVEAKRYVVDKGFGSKSEMTNEELR